ncbi:MAG: class I tRNA ligase family protein, partial [Chloroflexota bacterium]
ISALMIYASALDEWKGRVGADAWREALSVLLRLLAPLAPHLAEELWARTGGAFSVHQQPWPEYDPALAADELTTWVAQVDGRVRDRITAAADLDEDAAVALALASEGVQRALAGRPVARAVFVPGKVVNLVSGG